MMFLNLMAIVQTSECNPACSMMEKYSISDLMSLGLLLTLSYKWNMQSKTCI